MSGEYPQVISHGNAEIVPNILEAISSHVVCNNSSSYVRGGYEDGDWIG